MSQNFPKFHRKINRKNPAGTRDNLQSIRRSIPDQRLIFAQSLHIYSVFIENMFTINNKSRESLYSEHSNNEDFLFLTEFSLSTLSVTLFTQIYWLMCVYSQVNEALYENIFIMSWACVQSSVQFCPFVCPNQLLWFPYSFMSRINKNTRVFQTSFKCSPDSDFLPYLS